MFASNRNGAFNLYLKPADGSGDAQRLTESEQNQFPDSWHPGGRHISLAQPAPNNSFDMPILELEGSEESGWKAKEVADFLSTPSNEVQSSFSPDGKWMAYA